MAMEHAAAGFNNPSTDFITTEYNDIQYKEPILKPEFPPGTM